MPGEFVEHTYAGPMAPETVHFLEAVVYDRPVMVTPSRPNATKSSCSLRKALEKAA